MDVKIEFVVKLLMFRSVVIITASVHGDKNVKLNHKEKVSLFRVILLMLHMIICKSNCKLEQYYGCLKHLLELDQNILIKL